MAETKAPDGSGDLDESPRNDDNRSAAPPPPGPSQPQEFPLSMPPGTVIDGRYRVEKPLGHGGFGQVYRCVEVETGTRVAIKVLRPHHACGPRSQEIVQVFLNEAQILAGFEHPILAWPCGTSIGSRGIAGSPARRPT